MTYSDSEETEGKPPSWDNVTDTIILHIFQYLSSRHLLTAGETCKLWNRLAYDEFLWRDLFYRDFSIKCNVGIMPGKKSWYSEYKRLDYHTPIVETEVLTQHTHQVLHVSFSHNGKYFATCSKDGYILVWTASYPAKVKHSHDMKSFSWKYTQYSQFNETDTLLLVSGVHFGTPQSTSGEIAVFSLQDGFNLQCRVVNKPYDIFGTWYSEEHLLSGDLQWLAQLVSSSGLWLNKAYQDITSEHTPITVQLYRFYNVNASTIRSVMVANCVAPEPCPPSTTDDTLSPQSRPPLPSHHSHQGGGSGWERGNPVSYRDLNRPLPLPLPLPYPQPSTSSEDSHTRLETQDWQRRDSDMETLIQYNAEYRRVEKETAALNEETTSSEGSCEENTEMTSIDELDDLAKQPEKFLIFTTGCRTYTPHQIGFKRIKKVSFPARLDPGLSLVERIAVREQARARYMSGHRAQPEPDWLNYAAVADRFDSVDHIIDLHGHIIGMCLSPDHRYLYVNCRPWPEDCIISNPFDPPPIAQEIDIHVIDLATLQEVGIMLRSHKAYTPNNECFLIFLDVCDEYVASGAEDRHGYLWDRHYGSCLAKYPHNDVVNCTAFNPTDPQTLVTTSDDYSIKVWRSRALTKQLVGGDAMKRMGRGVRIETKPRRRQNRSRVRSNVGMTTR
uniref:F-box/WD repeat-containing protein 5 n=1 Tax=Cacopsylla melanoneura TaxID=428564 RepID=A0A8D9BL72_9HEMI